MTDPRAVAKGIISGWYQSTEAAAGFTLGIAEHEWQRLEAIIAAVLADAERREAERCAKDVCMYCGGRALGYSPVIGPNQAGNYIHATPKATGKDVLCRASGIYSRLRAQAQADKEE